VLPPGGGHQGGSRAAPAPESNEVLPPVCLVDESVGDHALAPFRDLGLGAPPLVAHGEPKLGVIPIE
jgi:hypothetical protein